MSDQRHKKTLFILIVSPILVVFITFLFIQKPTHNFLHPDYTYLINSDQVSGLGKSEITSIQSNQGVKLSYILKEGDPYPFVSMVFKAKNNELFDTEDYILKFHLESDSDQELSIRLGLALEDHTQLDNPDSYLFVEKSIPIAKGKNQFKLALNEIVRTPSWWFIHNKLSELNLPAPSRNKTGYLAIYDVRFDLLNKKRNLHITEFSIHPTYYNFYKYSVIGLIIYGFLIYVVYKFRGRKSNSILVPIDLSFNDRIEKDYPGLIITYLAQNFNNPDLKVEDVAKEVGLSENQISLEIKNYSGKSFKSYLNFLRIEKAKKLLMESDLPVSQIAYEVGYNSPHHFIRVFKESESCSPTVFRSENSKNNST